MLKHRISALASTLRTLACQALGFGLILAAFSSVTHAGVVATPENDAGSLVAGLTLLSGGILVITNRARRK